MSTSTKQKSSAPALVSLSPEQVRHILRPHAGFDAYAEELMALYDANQSALGDAGIDTAYVLDVLDKYRALRAAELAAEQQLALVRETRLNFSSIVWRAELEVYARCTRAGKTQPLLLKAVAAFAAFLKHRRPHKKAAPIPSVTTNGA